MAARARRAAAAVRQRTIWISFDQFWIGVFAQGIALAIIFLSYTLVTGEGGLISLCQITLAGIGAFARRPARRRSRLAGLAGDPRRARCSRCRSDCSWRCRACASATSTSRCSPSASRCSSSSSCGSATSTTTSAPASSSTGRSASAITDRHRDVRDRRRGVRRRRAR